MKRNHQWQGKNWFFTAAVSIFLSVILSACDNEQENREVTTKSTDVSIILSADGIGPINATTSFNMHQMTLAFSEYNVVEEVNYLQDSPFPAIRVSEGVNTIMTVIPDASQKNIYSVIIEDKIIKNSLGHPLGSLYNEIYTYGQNEQCQMGSADMTGKVLCYAPKTPNILYVFNGKWDNATVGTKPPADILQDWILEIIIWRPKT